jgi:hypothetical protein
MRESSFTWWFSELNKKIFFSAYSQRIDPSVWIKASREGRSWLLRNDDSRDWKGIPELSYDPSENTTMPNSSVWKGIQVLTVEELQREVTWQQRYFFESQKTKGCLFVEHPAPHLKQRIPDVERTARLVYNLYFFSCNQTS